MSVGALDRRTLICAVIAAGLASPAFGLPAQGGLDGEWIGALENITGPRIAAPPDGEFPEVRLQINQRNVRVWLGSEEVKPGTFEIRREGSNAVISSVQSDPSARSGQSWVETWTFVVTLADTDTLAVNYVRVVNNNTVARTEDGAYFSQIRTGQFRRVAR